MRKTNKLLAALIATVVMVSSAMAQAPQKMSYQSVIRNASGALVANQAVGVKISLLQGSATGTAVYVETQNPTTNANGLASFQMGGGTVVSGSFASINWAAGPYFVKTETDPTGGSNYSIAGTTQLLSVAYALYAANSGTPGAKGDSGISIRNTKVNGDSLFVTLSNGQTLNAGYVRGLKGDSGVSLTNASIVNDSLKLFLSNSKTLNAGSIGGSSLGHTIIYDNPGTFTWTVPNGVTTVFVEALSAGGGGGGGGNFQSSWGSGGGGGASGSYSKLMLKVTPNTTIPIIIGLGGSGGNSQSVGMSGGNTLFGNFIFLEGGGGGGNGCSRCSGGVGGIATGNGSKGGNGACYSCWTVVAGGDGAGGGSVCCGGAFGGGGGAGAGTATNFPNGDNGNNAYGFGAGGGGGGGANNGANGGNGGNGGNGYIIIHYN